MSPRGEIETRGLLFNRGSERALLEAPPVLFSVTSSRLLRKEKSAQCSLFSVTLNLFRSQGILGSPELKAEISRFVRNDKEKMSPRGEIETRGLLFNRGSERALLEAPPVLFSVTSSRLCEKSPHFEEVERSSSILLYESAGKTCPALFFLRKQAFISGECGLQKITFSFFFLRIFPYFYERPSYIAMTKTEFLLK